MSKKLLLVEDHPSNQKLYSLWLEKVGYLVITVDSSENAIIKLAEEPFDLVITDIALPGQMTGLQLGILIRENEKTSNIPILCVTAYSMSIAMYKGCCDVMLQKPFSQEVFLLQIQILLGE